MEQLDELEKPFLEEYEAASMLHDRKMNKSALILFSKSLFALLDYRIFKRYAKLPKNHTDRFRLLRTKEPKIYELVDPIWSKYTDSYSKPTDTESIKSFKEIIKRIIEENEGFSKKIEEAVE